MNASALAFALFGLAFLAWIVAAVSFFRVLRLRLPQRRALPLLSSSFQSLDSRNYRPEAAPHLRRLRLGLLVFLLAAVSAVVVAVLSRP